MENSNTVFNWDNNTLYTKEFKEWIWKLIRKIHARIGHVEEKMATKKQVAIVVQDLSTAIEIAGSTVKEINGEPRITERANDDFVSTTAIQNEGTVYLDSNLQMAINVSTGELPEGYISQPATGVASDQYVRDYIESAFAWKIINN